MKSVVRGWATGLAMLVAATGVLRADDPALTADEIMDKSAKAVWGDNYKALKSMKIETSMVFVAQGMKGTVTVLAKAPNKSLQTFEIPGVMKSEGGYDGQVGWAKDSMSGLRALDGAELAQSKLDSWFYGDAEWRDHYSKVSLEGEETFEDRPVYVLTLEAEGVQPKTAWVDKETFLTLSSKATMDSPQGTMEIRNRYLDYKPLDGKGLEKILVPRKVKTTMGPAEIEGEIKKIECNVEIDDKVFAMPPEEEEEGDDEGMSDEDAGQKDEGKK